jgi:anti-sigma regulatory factor (Ser/Thr protein kinase)
MDCVAEFHNEMRIRTDGIERAVEHIMELVRRLPCTSVDLDDVELALHEALANAVVHGNRLDPRKSVQICGFCCKRGWPQFDRVRP